MNAQEATAADRLERNGDLISFDLDPAQSGAILARNESDPRTALKEELVGSSRQVTSGQPSVYFLQPRQRQSATLPLRWFEMGQPNPSMPHKIIALMGATGSGKSRLVDAMVNHVVGVRRMDRFRFRMVPDEGRSNALSQTTHITSYTLHYREGFTVPYSLTIIDTPGYGDTEGLERDEQITRSICSFLTEAESNVREINAICFVASSADVRLTSTQKYIISSVLSLFGKDVVGHIRLLATFSDGGKPPVVDSCHEAGFPLTVDASTGRLAGYFKFNNSVLFAGNDNVDDKINEMFWLMAENGFKDFFADVGQLPSKCLAETKKVVRHRIAEDETLQEIDRLLNSVVLKRIQFGKEEDHRTPEREKIETLLNDLSKAEQDIESSSFRTGLRTQQDFVNIIRNRLERDKPQDFQNKIAILGEWYAITTQPEDERDSPSPLSTSRNLPDDVTSSVPITRQPEGTRMSANSNSSRPPAQQQQSRNNESDSGLCCC